MLNKNTDVVKGDRQYKKQYYKYIIQIIIYLYYYVFCVHVSAAQSSAN